MKKCLPPPPRTFSVLAYLCVCLNAAALKYYELTDTPAFFRLAAEDSLIENLTAVLLFSAGTLLLVTGRMERKSLRRWIYVVGGTVLLFIAGEEISWGQRIFGYSTPDWIAESNRQGEFNLHNLQVLQSPLNAGFRYGVLFLCMMACVAFFAGRERIRGIPVPSILLTLSLLAIHSYHYDRPLDDFFTTTFRALSRVHNTLICLIIIFALFRRQQELLIFSASAILLSLALTVTNHLETFPSVGLQRGEVFEYLIALSIFCYSLELFLNRDHIIQTGRSVRRSNSIRGENPSAHSFEGSAHPVGQRFSCIPDPHPTGNSGRPLQLRSLLLPTSMSIMSIGLASSAYVDYRSERTYARDLAQEIASPGPIIRSHFNVHIVSNRIIYWKERCSWSDVSRPFFLYVIPTDLHESPIARRFTFFEYGTASYRNASYWDRARIRRGSCFLIQPLPRWEIAGIGTGQDSRWAAVAPADQHVDDGRGGDRFERDVDRSITRSYRQMYDAVVSREPRVRSDFDIYLHDRILIFVKESCMRSDVEATFFLHVIPVDNASLPSYRQAHRFDNLDFRFSDFGTAFDDKCIALVSLPAYDMSRIVSGQYTSEKRLWQVEVPFHDK